MALAGPLPALADAAAGRRAHWPWCRRPSSRNCRSPRPPPAAPRCHLADCAPEPPASPTAQPLAQAERPVHEAIAAADATPRPSGADVRQPVAPPDDAKLWALSDAKLAPPPADPLAAIMMLSEEERIALFT